MEKELPLFPLNLVAFPGEHLNLHIFESRYKQLINDCLLTKTTFGIPSYALNKIEYGTEVIISEVTKVYDDGRMDVKTEGVRIFKVVDFENEWQHKEYAGGVVQLLKFDEDRDESLHIQIVDMMRELFSWLKMDDQIGITYDQSIYNYVHKIGLKLDEEYALLGMKTEQIRQEYIFNHLQKLLPMLERAEAAREKIRQNGHFKHLDPLKF